MRDHNKPKFDKNKCVKCKYHGVGMGYSVKINGETRLIHCNANGFNITTVTRSPEGKVIDMRGEDYKNCRLFTKS